MATKYGYVSRDKADRQIDWNAIGSQVTDEIQRITQDRKERKEDILKQSTDYAKMLVEMPMGSNTAFNEYLAQFTAQASQAALEDLNSLKRGEITEQEYYNRRANLKSGTELMIAGATNFNKNYDVIQERIDKGIASAVEIKYRAKMAELLEFGNRTPFINPDTREVNTARLAPSGIMETTVEDIASASDMFRISNFQLDKFDMNGTLTKMKNELGVQQYTDSKTGNTIKYAFNEELMTTKEIQQAKKDLVSAYMKNDKDVISILTDFVPGYDATLDPFEVDDKTILINRDGTYQITDEQRQVAEDYMIDKLDQSLSRTVIPGMTEAEKRRLEVSERQVSVTENRLKLDEKKFKETQKMNQVTIDKLDDEEKSKYKPWNNTIFIPAGKTPAEATDITKYLVTEYGDLNDREFRINKNNWQANFIEDIDAGLLATLENPDGVINRFVTRKDADGNDVTVYQIQVPGVIDGIASFEIGEDATNFVTGINALYSLIVSASRAGTKITQEQINEIFGGTVDQYMG